MFDGDCVFMEDDVKILQMLNKYFTSSGISLCDSKRCGSKCKYARTKPFNDSIEVMCYCNKFKVYLDSKNYNFLRTIKCKLLYPYWLIKRTQGGTFR